jgi:hypothetical protein
VISGSAGCGLSGYAGTVWFTKSTITENSSGICTGDGGSALSFGDNTLFNNGTDGAFTGSALTYK